MSPDTKAIFAGLRNTTTAVLADNGGEPFANQVFHCVFGSRCGKHYCPLCIWSHSLDLANHSKNVVTRAAADFEAATGKPLSLFAFTTTTVDIPVMALRETADRMALKLWKTVSKRKKVILGSASFFEASPAQVRGAVTDLVYPHWHGLIGVSDPDDLAMRAFTKMPHFEQVNLKQAMGWIEYGCKARPAQFQDHWEALMSQRDTFIERFEQMKSFQPGRFTGMFREARAA